MNKLNLLNVDYGWSSSETSLILSSFFWGYVVMQIPAGWLAGLYGAKNLVCCSLFFSGVLTILTEVAADVGGVWLVCASRAVQGLFQGFIFPCMHTLLAKWIPPEESDRLGTIIYSGAQMGTVISMTASGALADSAAGWPSIFYVFGGITMLWSFIYFFLGADTPEKHKYISKEEKAYIEEELVSVSNQKKLRTPWSSILTSIPVWALLAAHCAQNWGFYTLLTEMPSYFSNVLGFDIASNGMLSAVPYLVMWHLSFIFVGLSHLVRRRNLLSLGSSRKLFNSIAHWGPAVSLIVLSFIEVENSTVAVVLLVVTVALDSASYLGFQMNHIDLSPNFAGTLMGITNAAANVMSLIAPLVVGIIVKENTPEEWRTVFLIAAGIYFLGNLMFVVCGKAEVQSWNEPPRPKKSHSVNYGSTNAVYM